MKNTYILFFGSIFGFFIVFVGIGRAANYTFTWDPPHPNDNVVRYKIYYRLNSSTYDLDKFEPVPKPSSDQKFNPADPVWKITLPTIDEEYCFTATAIDDDGLESGPSIEVGHGATCGQLDYVDIVEKGGDDGGGGGGGGCFIKAKEAK
jgi:hypothetical protein